MDEILATRRRHIVQIDNQLARCRTMIDFADREIERLPPYLGGSSDKTLFLMLSNALECLHLAVRKLHEPDYESAEEIRERLDRERTS